MSHTAPFPVQPSQLEVAAIAAPVVPHPMLGQPGFERLHRMRRRFSWTLTAAMLAIYFGFILTLAFRPGWLAVPVTPGQPMTIGIPIGFGMFAVTFALVAVYVHRSNVTFDKMITDIREGAQR
ncbi:DUF485 domain-containing protein [Cupriavidus necator]